MPASTCRCSSPAAASAAATASSCSGVSSFGHDHAGDDRAQRRRGRRRRTTRSAPGSPARTPRCRGARPRARAPTCPGVLSGRRLAVGRHRVLEVERDRVGRRARQLAQHVGLARRARTAGCAGERARGSRRPAVPVHERVAAGAWHTSSSRWLKPRCSNVTMPWSGRDFDSRAATTSDSPWRVSPANIGAGNATSSNPRLATVVPCVVSSTEMPTSRPRVKRLLTSGRPNSVPAAYSASRWSARRVQRHGGEEHVVGLGDRAGERVRHDEADGQLLEPPSVMRRLHSGRLLLVSRP